MIPEIRETRIEEALFFHLRKGGHFGIAIEIGCWTGETTKFLGNKFSCVYAIDPFIGKYDDSDPCSGADFNEVAEKFRENCYGCNSIDYVEFEAVEGLKHIPDCCVDFAFIDGCHKEEEVTRDMGILLPKMSFDRPWTMVFNSADRKGVRDAIGKFCNTWGFCENNPYLIVITKDDLKEEYKNAGMEV